MKALGVFPAKRHLAIVDHPHPQRSRPADVKMRMLEVGVCGTDKDIANFLFGTPPAGSPYLILGHESLAEVVETGPEAQGLAEGDLVVGMVRLPCPDPTCDPCRAGRQDFCATGDYRERGIKDLHGFMTEFVVEDQRYLKPIPRELRPVAVLTEPLTIAEKAFLELQQIQGRLPPKARKRAVVLGAGPVGLLGAMVLLEAGYETWVYSRAPQPNPKAEVAEAAGARYLSSEEVPMEKFAAEVGEIDVVYEAVGAAQIAFDLLPCLGANGVYVFTGVPRGGEAVRFPVAAVMHNLILKNQVVIGTVNAGHDAFDAAVRDLGTFLRRWPGPLCSMITGRYPLEAFAQPVEGRAGGIKNVVVLDRSAL